MAYTKRVWKGRQGTGLNKFSIDGATPVTVVNQPDSLIEAGDALSAGNLNDLETRIDDAFNAVDAEVATKADETEVTDLKNAIDANSNRISNLEQEHGGYVTVNYRGTNAVPTGKAKYGLVEKIVGKSRAWNNLAYRDLATIKTINTGGTWNDNAYSYNGLTFTVNADGSVTVSGTASANSSFAVTTQIIGGTSKNYLLVGCPSGGSTTTYMFGSNVDGAYDTGNGYIHQIGGSTQRFSVRIYGGYTISGSLTFKPIVRDLTLIFPEGVPSTVAECVQKCPDILKYDAYGTSIVDTTVEGVKSVGVNIWDEEWELGTISSTTGQNTSSSSLIRSKNYIPVIAGETYYYKGMTATVGSGAAIYCYDVNKNFISFIDDKQNSSFTIPSNCQYIRFIQIGTTYNNSIQICLNSYTDKTTYHPYTTDTLSLPTPVTLRSAGSVAEEYDLETGEKTNLIESVDLEQTNFTLYEGSDYWFFIGYVENSKPAQSSASVVTQMTSRYKSVTTNSIGYADNTISLNSTTLRIRTDSKTNPPKGILNYALATPDDPTQLTPVIDNTILTEGGGTIDTIQTQTPVIDNCLDVGYLAL